MADGPRPAAPCVRVTFECARINTFRQTLGEIVEQADQQTADWTNQRDRLCRNQRRKIVKCAAATTSTGSMRVSQEGPLEKENPTCREARRMKCEKQIQFKRQIISFPPNAVNFPSIDRSANVAWGSCDHKDQKWPFKNAIWSLRGNRLSKERFSLRLIFQIKPESWLFLSFPKCKFVQNFSSFNFSSILFSRSDAQCIS